ncbi:MAG: hydantoinase/oxoprolinase family protein [Pseudomonadota bacterium]
MSPNHPLAGHIVGVDVGGTFTDLIVIEPSGTVRVAKTPTTPDNQAQGVLNAIAMAAIPLNETTAIIHGTTTTTNAVLERQLAPTGLITTKGFRDVLELGRRTRPNAYGMTGTFEPLIPRELRREVAERMTAEGDIHIALDESALRDELRNLIDAGCESLVIHFLHAYRNPTHERRAKAIASSVWPNNFITVGHEISSEYREYERGTAAAVNATVRPVLQRYIDHLVTELNRQGYENELLVMRGNGGTVSARKVSESAVHTVMSGPASGVMAAAYSVRAANIANAITYDMGGTSCDAGLIRDGVPSVSSELEVAYALPIHLPMVDVHTIGAGGGSIARVNDAGLLEVGPRSAGAVPGPICYARGGTEPTTTDANFVLGRLNPQRLLAVASPVSVTDVQSRVGETIGRRLDLTDIEACAAILRIAENQMASALRMVSLARGHDPRDFVLFAFGGAGPLHAAALAVELGIPTVMIPPRPGITNALGCAVADLRHDYVNTLNEPLATMDMSSLHQVLANQEADGRAALETEPVTLEAVSVLRFVEMQFQGQSHLLSVAIDGPKPSRETLQEVFDDAYWQRFAVTLPEVRAVVVNVHTAVLGHRNTLPAAALNPSNADPMPAAPRAPAERDIWFEDRWHQTPVYRRECLGPEQSIRGPAVVEQLDTTIVIPPGCEASQDSLGNLFIKVAT